MFFSDWRLLLRRWYVVVVGLLATLAMCFLASRVVSVQYQATAGILMLPPKSTEAGVPDNPFLSLGGLDTVSGVIARAATDRVMQAEVAKAGGTGSYTVEPDLASGGPVLLITVEDVTPQGALTTLAVVSKKLPELLTELQTSSGVRESALIRARELIKDNVAQPVRKPLIRALLVVTAVGLAGTVLLASLFDGFFGRRSALDEAEPEPQPAVNDGPRPRVAESAPDQPWAEERPSWVDHWRPPERGSDPVVRNGTHNGAYTDARWTDGHRANGEFRVDVEAWAEAGNAWADGVRADVEARDGGDHRAEHARSVAGMHGTVMPQEPVDGASNDAAANTEAADVAAVDEETRTIPTANGVPGISRGRAGAASEGPPVNGRAGAGAASDGRPVNGRGMNGTRHNGTAMSAGSPRSPGPVARGPAQRASERSSLPWWAPTTDPDPTQEIVYNRTTDPDPTVEIAYDRLAASLRDIQDDSGTESG